MPLIQVQLGDNSYTPEQKKQMITRLSGTMAAIVGEGLDAITCVVVEQLESSPFVSDARAMPIEVAHALASRGANPAPTFDELLQSI